MRCERVVPLLFIAGSIFVGGTAHAQVEQCESCVRRTLLAELTTAAAAIIPSRNQSVLRTPDGRLLVVQRFVDPPQIAVYDSTGRFRELYDAAGGGPGEFRSAPSLFAAPGNDIWALDQDRLVRFDSRLRHIDTRALGAQYFVSDLIVIADSVLLLTARTSKPSDSVFSVSLMDTAWTARRTLQRPADRYGLALIAPAASDGFWTLGINQLLLRRYTDDGAFHRSVEIVSPHFDPWQGPLGTGGREGFDVPPRPRHNVLYDPGDNRIVVVTRVADEDWTPTPTDQMFDPSERDENALYDSILSVIDAASGRTIQTQRFGEYLKPVNGAPGLVFATDVDRDGHVITKVYRLQVP